MSTMKNHRNVKGNKIYRAPSTPDIEILKNREKSFILDGKAMSNMSLNYSRANPKLASVIPPYNGQKDRSTANYFKIRGNQITLKKNYQSPPGTSIEGVKYENFFKNGPGGKYLSYRNINGCGYSPEVYEGHTNYLADVKDLNIGMNGRYGYRRNTPFLRKYPSPFGVLTQSSLYN